MKDKIKIFLMHPITRVILLCFLAVGSFWALSIQDDRTAEVRIYNNGVKLMLEGSISEAFQEFTRVTETDPHNSQIDAMAEYQMAWMLVKFGDGEFETLQNARALWVSALRKSYPDKDTAINIELLISKMEDALAEQGLSGEEIEGILDGEGGDIPGDGEGQGGGSENEHNY